MSRISCLLVAAALVVPIASEAAPSRCFRYSGGVVTILGTLGGNGCRTADINASGQIVGDSDLSPGNGAHAFLATGNTMTDLGALGGDYSYATAVNDAGQVAGRSTTADGFEHAFLYSAGSMIDLGTLPGQTFSDATGLNASGQVIGTSSEPDLRRAFLYSAGVMTDLGSLGGGETTPYDINDAGQVVGSSYTSGRDLRAFLYESGSMTDLGTLGGEASVAIAINEAGQITGYAQAADTFWHAFLYDAGTMIDLGAVPSMVPSFGFAISEDGRVVGRSDSTGSGRAFLYDSGVATDLGAGSGQDINNSGQVLIWSYPSVRIDDGGTSTTIEALEGTSATFPAGINDAGQVAGYFEGAFCPDEPLPGCLAPGRATLRVRDGTPDAVDQISWKWSRGPELDYFDFASRYALLCIYDTSAGTTSLATRLEIQDDYSFWQGNLFTSNKYYSKYGNDDGVFRASFKAGSEGRSSVSLAARGLKTRMPTAFSGTEMFDQESGVTVQLFKNGYEACWTSTFATADRNSPTHFKASLP